MNTFYNKQARERTGKKVTSIMNLSYKKKEELHSFLQLNIIIYILKNIHLFWVNLMNLMMGDCWMWRNAKTVEYQKLICALNIGTQSYDVRLLNIMQHTNGIVLKINTRKIISDLILKIYYLKSHWGMTKVTGI